MKDILANQNFTLDVEILDKGKKIYNSPATSKNEKPLVIKDQQITLYGKTWTIHYEAGQDFGIPAIQQAVPKAILGIGIVISILLFITVLSLTTTQRRAIGMAETMTEDIREKNKQLEIVNTNLSKEVAERKKAEEILQNKTDELERTNDAMVGRELKMIALKKQLKEKNHE